MTEHPLGLTAEEVELSRASYSGSSPLEDSLRARITALEAEVARNNELLDTASQGLNTLTAANEKLIAEVARLRADSDEWTIERATGQQQLDDLANENTRLREALEGTLREMRWLFNLVIEDDLRQLIRCKIAAAEAALNQPPAPTAEEHHSDRSERLWREARDAFDPADTTPTNGEEVAAKVAWAEVQASLEERLKNVPETDV